MTSPDAICENCCGKRLSVRLLDASHCLRTIAGPERAAGGMLESPALILQLASRTITDRFPGQETQTWDRSSDPEMRRAAPARTALIRRLAKLQQRNDYSMGQRLSAARLLRARCFH